jgi:hypothetical protein
MSAKDFPAFPVFPETSAGHEAAHQGMTLRDYFAAKAMQSLVTEPHDDIQDFKLEFEGQTIDLISVVSYEIADAMLKARGT